MKRWRLDLSCDQAGHGVARVFRQPSRKITFMIHVMWGRNACGNAQHPGKIAVEKCRGSCTCFNFAKTPHKERFSSMIGRPSVVDPINYIAWAQSMTVIDSFLFKATSRQFPTSNTCHLYNFSNIHRMQAESSIAQICNTSSEIGLERLGRFEKVKQTGLLQVLGYIFCLLFAVRVVNRSRRMHLISK